MKQPVPPRVNSQGYAIVEHDDAHQRKRCTCCGKVIVGNSYGAIPPGCRREIGLYLCGDCTDRKDDDWMAGFGRLHLNGARQECT
jgi:hypothetical protein